jgi:hypothetical protein
MNIAQKIESAKDSFGQGICLEQELIDFGGSVVDSSDWSSHFNPEPWKFWEFPDHSQLFVKGNGRNIYIRSY